MFIYICMYKQVSGSVIRRRRTASRCACRRARLVSSPYCSADHRIGAVGRHCIEPCSPSHASPSSPTGSNSWLPRCGLAACLPCCLLHLPAPVFFLAVSGTDAGDTLMPRLALVVLACSSACLCGAPRITAVQPTLRAAVQPERQKDCLLHLPAPACLLAVSGTEAGHTLASKAAFSYRLPSVRVAVSGRPAVRPSGCQAGPQALRLWAVYHSLLLSLVV